MLVTTDLPEGKKIRESWPMENASIHFCVLSDRQMSLKLLLVNPCKANVTRALRDLNET